MDSDIKVSVIIPMHNVEKYIEKCINSLLSQSLKELEFIFIDDGSTDRTVNIVERYKDKRIKLIKKKSNGVSSARNAGLDIAIGKYVGFVDSDDWIAEDMYEKLFYIAEEKKCDIVQAKYRKVYNSELNSVKSKESINITTLTNKEAINNLYTKYAEEMVVCWNKIYKRDLFLNIRFPVGKIHEDEFTTPQLLYKAKKICCIDQELYYYRQRSNSIMTSKFSIKNLDYLYAIKSRVKFVKENKEKELYIKTINLYAEKLIEMYFKCKENNLDNCQDFYNIKREYNKIFKEVLCHKQRSYRYTIGLILFRINTDLYMYMKDYNNKIRKIM